MHPGADEGAADAGAAYVCLGGVTGDLDEDDATAVLHGEESTDQAGAALAGPGDFDGDGVPDLVAGAERQGSVAAYGGAAWLVLASGL